MSTRDEHLLTAEELAEYLHRPIRWVRQNAKELAGFKVGALWRFDLDEVKATLAATRNPDLSEKTPEHLDLLSPTPLSAKRQASRRVWAA